MAFSQLDTVLTSVTAKYWQI